MGGNRVVIRKRIFQHDKLVFALDAVCMGAAAKFVPIFLIAIPGIGLLWKAEGLRA